MSYAPSIASSTATLVGASQPKSKGVPHRDYEAALGQLSASYGYGCHFPAPQKSTTTASSSSSSSSSFWKFGKKSASSSKSTKSTTSAPAEKRAHYPQPQYKDCSAALGDLMSTYGAPGGSAGPVSKHPK
ncbi:hypothetical protein CONPUDRAFT_169868 [Coniophora puteana RWD-64-598 SS2]|uniref:Uncharacterized protein n=1 Tax=Coniophora puteana (strain RWD-64-598) TaxID=741705 RepID=A0A5M3M8P9_CONPW|nr:uncharacterized protein CONPUDRAFT_169868 [Coniophora puteana RWD-64-598 SS2]EIW75011.1 hypothetical protein CONPUDRAFT_169868 [Coniophora puteana RWD-64-598 SS2]